MSSHLLFATLFVWSILKPLRTENIVKLMGIPLEVTITLFFLYVFIKKWKTGSWSRRSLKITALFLIFFVFQILSLAINWRSYDSLYAIVFVGLATVGVSALLPMSWTVFSERFTLKDRWIGLGILLFVHLVGFIQIASPDISKPLVEATLGIDGIRPGAVNSIMSATTVYGTFSAITLVFSLTGFTVSHYWTWSSFGGLRFFYKVLFMLIALFSLIGGIFSGSRNFIWSASIGCIYIVWKKRHMSRKLVPVILAASLLFLSLLHVAAFTNRTIGNKLAPVFPYIDKIRKHQDVRLNDFVPQMNNRALSNRIAIWKTALDMWERKPFLGHGPGAFRLNAVFPQRLNVHNFYLQSLVETGIIGFSAFLLLLFYILKTMSSDSRIGIILTVMAALVFDNFLDYSPSWTLALAYTLSWPEKREA